MRARSATSIPMTSMVRFEAAGTAYCLPVAATRAVRASDDLVALPDPARDVVGIIPGEPPLPVISPLQANGKHILVLEVGDQAFGLIVDVVIGLRQVPEHDIRPAPPGQGRPLVSGTLDDDGRLVFVADPTALAARL